VSILWVQSIFYIPTVGGENRANRAWLEQLARCGHTCRVVAPAFGPQGPSDYDSYRSILRAQGICPVRYTAEVESFHINGIDVFAVVQRNHLHRHVRELICRFMPTWVLVSSLDPGQLLLDTCVATCPSHVIYLAHTPQHFPFGSESIAPNPKTSLLLERIRAIVTIGEYMAHYVRSNVQCQVSIVHPPVYRVPFSVGCHDVDDGFITIVNPSAVKGIAIFCALTKLFPERRFGALVGWATTEADRKVLAEMPNVELWEPVADIAEVLSKTSVLLVPSLYLEGFGLVAVEAMLWGIPVLASDYGGLRDASLGVGQLLPVRPIQKYRTHFDDRGFPVPLVPEQDVGPWRRALKRLMDDRAYRTRLSERSRTRATEFVSSLEGRSLPRFLTCLASEANVDPAMSGQLGTCRRDQQWTDCLSTISPKKRTLLALQLRKNGREA